MSMPSLFDPTIARLSYGLDGLSQRQSLIAANVANVDTPGYLTHDVPFEQALTNAMQGQAAVPESLPGAITRNDLRVRNDGNNVDVNQQMTELAGATVVYQAATQLVSAKFALLASAIAPIA
jgi:flagellar basal-body rod protein FlgB